MTQSPDPDVVRTDKLLITVSAAPRRRVLWRLLEEERTHIDDVATTSAKTIDYYHNHLPRLKREGYIDWDASTGLITRGPQYHEAYIGAILRTIEDTFGEGAVR